MTDDQITNAITNLEPSPPSLGGNENKIELKPDKKLEAMEVCEDSGASEGRDAGGDVRTIRAEEESKSMLEEAVQMVLDVSDVSDGEASSSQTLHTEQGLDSSRIKQEDPLFKENSHGGNGEGMGGFGEERTRGGGEGGSGVGGEEEGGDCEDEVMDVEEKVEQDRVQITILSAPEIEGDKKVGTGTLGESRLSEGDKSMVNTLNFHQLRGTTEASELLEMKLRRRALESELRRSNRNKARSIGDKGAQQIQAGKGEDEEAVTHRGQTTNTVRNQSTLERQDEAMNQTLGEDFISIHPQYEASREDEEEKEGGSADEGGGGMNVGDFLEERLRKRALQSMLARRKTKSKT